MNPTPPLTAPHQGAPIRSTLDGALVHGIAWTGGMKWAGQVLTWSSTLIVARILAPEDYGLVAMASIYMGIVSLVSEFGVGTSVIKMRDLSEGQIAQINGFSVLMGLGAFGLSCVAAVPLGRFFNAPQLPAVVVVMSGSFIMTGFRVVPAALLSREMRFRTLALIDGSRTAIMALAMVTFALLGLRYWALVVGALVSSALYTTMTLSRRRHRIARPHRRDIGTAMSFSTHVLVSRLAYYIHSSSDFLIAGRILGQAPLGAYSMAWTLASVPVEKVTTLVMKVTPSIFSAAQDDPPALRRYLLRLTEAVSLISFPVAFGVALVADEFVVTVLGDKWLAAILPLRLLAGYSAVRSVTPLFAPILTAIGMQRAVMWNNFLGLALLPAAFLVGARWGTVGIAAAWLVAHPVVVAVIGARTLRAIGLTVSEYLSALKPAIGATLPMAATVLALQWWLGDGLVPSVRLGIEATGGAAVYLLVLMLWHRERMLAFRRIVAVWRS